MLFFSWQTLNCQIVLILPSYMYICFTGGRSTRQKNHPKRKSSFEQVFLNKIPVGFPDSCHREEGKSSREPFEKVRVNAVFFGISGCWVGFWASIVRMWKRFRCQWACHRGHVSCFLISSEQKERGRDAEGSVQKVAPLTPPASMATIAATAIDATPAKKPRRECAGADEHSCRYMQVSVAPEVHQRKSCLPARLFLEQETGG